MVVVAVVAAILIGIYKKDNGGELKNSGGKVDYNKAIVIYFSRAGENYSVGTVDVGNTEMMASYIIDYLKADSFKIEPKVPYPTSYDEVYTQANLEKDAKARPEIMNSISNLSDYDTIFLGYPIWCGDLPMVMYSFMEKYDLSGKTIIPFNTHEGSNNSGTYAIIAEKLPNSKVNMNGLYLKGSVARTEDGRKQTVEWLEALGY